MMSSKNRVGGIIYVKIDGGLIRAKGDFTYNIGEPKRTSVIGADSVHGFTEEIQAGMIEGAVTDSGDFSLQNLLRTCDATITLELNNGKTIMLREAWFAGEGNVNTKEGEIEVKFEGIDAEEISA